MLLHEKKRIAEGHETSEDKWCGMVVNRKARRGILFHVHDSYCKEYKGATEEPNVPPLATPGKVDGGDAEWGEESEKLEGREGK
jgi:hypothetical protein